MSTTPSNGIRERIVSECCEAGRALKEFGRSAVTFDRSRDRFGDGSINAQLKGRDAVIKKTIIGGIIFGVFTAWLGYCAADSSTFTAAGYAMLTITSCATLLLFKEAIIQQVARVREKRQHHITEETADMRTPVRELWPATLLQRGTFADEELGPRV